VQSCGDAPLFICHRWYGYSWHVCTTTRTAVIFIMDLRRRRDGGGRGGGYHGSPHIFFETSAGFAVSHDSVKLVVVRVRIKTGVFNRLGTAHERMLQLCLKSLLHVICCHCVLRTALRKKKIISTGYKSTRYIL